jgi:hypothetical protein
MMTFHFLKASYNFSFTYVISFVVVEGIKLFNQKKKNSLL